MYSLIIKKAVYLFAIISLLLLASCGGTNPYNLKEGEGAHLKNREEINGSARYLYLFRSINTSIGDEMLFPPETTMKWEQEVVYRIPSGVVTLGLDILYTPNYNAGFTKWLDANKYYEIHGGGIELNAFEGHTYQINCKVESGKAYIWIEDSNGTKVSETVRGGRVINRNYVLWDNLPDPAD